MKKILALALLCAVALAVYFFHPQILRIFFNISGAVEISPNLKADAVRPNTVCFVVVKNSTNIPVAAKTFVNPVFPLKFSITSGDLLISDPGNDSFRVEAVISESGKIGALSDGDMLGSMGRPVGFFATDVRVIIDKKIGSAPTYIHKSTETNTAHLFNF
ncbi:MAG: hypothetical protein NTW04_02645 [Elusimicrobia bacterium]|nr:hypothetical protein [Elusimicrobiota bacterium]